MFAIDKTEFIPYYKIPRIVEAIIAIALLVTWSFRTVDYYKYTDQSDEHNQKAVTILIFIVNGAFSIIFVTDIISQISGDPIDYTPMFLFLVTASVLYSGCAIYLSIIVFYKIFEAKTIIIIHIALPFLMTAICMTDCYLLINRKFGYT